MPQLEIYDRSTDPIDYLESFKVVMLLHGATDGVLYQTFLSTLRKVVRYWYSSLKPNFAFL